MIIAHQAACDPIPASSPTAFPPIVPAGSELDLVLEQPKFFLAFETLYLLFCLPHMLSSWLSLWLTHVYYQNSSPERPSSGPWLFPPCISNHMLKLSCLLVCFLLLPLEWECFEEDLKKDTSSLYLQHCLMHSRYLINVCWRNDFTSFPKPGRLRNDYVLIPYERDLSFYILLHIHNAFWRLWEVLKHFNKPSISQKYLITCIFLYKYIQIPICVNYPKYRCTTELLVWKLLV